MVNASEETGFETKSSNGQNMAAHIGAGLREVRERLGWKLPDIAEHIRIRLVFLSAIESGDLSSLPGPAYRVGFVRSYAQALGLDGEEILQRFRNAGQIGEAEQNEIKLLAPVPDRGVPKGAIIFIAFIIAIGGYGLWYHHTEETRKQAQTMLQIPAKLQPLTAPPKVTPPAAPAATTPANTASATPSSPAPATSAATPAATPASTGTVPASTPATSAASDNASPTATPAPTTTASTTTPAPAPGIVITATQPSWIQVTESNGTILFSKVLKAGQSWPVPQMAGLKMTTGNAGGTVISTNGKPGQPLGAAGAVLHGYQLTPPAQGSTANTASSTDTASAP